MKISIYIVDDEPMAIAYLKSLIKAADAGYEVIGSANNGAAAIPEIARLKPDIVFADISMPVMDGLQMAEKVLELQSPPVVFVLTSYRDFDYVKKGMQVGIRNYILKNELTEESLKELLEQTRGEIEKESRERHLILEHNIRNFLLSDGVVAEDLSYKEKPLQRYALIHLIRQRKVYLKNARKQEAIKVDCYEVNHVNFPDGISCSAFVEMSAGEYCGIIFIHENCVSPDAKLYLAGRAMMETFHKYCPDCIGLISDITTHFSDLPETWRKSRKMLEYMYAYETPQLFVEKELQPQIQTGVTVEEELKAFQESLVKERLMETQVALDMLLEHAKTGRSIWEYSNDVQDVYRCLREYVAKQKLNQDYVELKEYYPTVALLEKRLYKCVDDVLYEMRQRRELHYSSYVIDAVKFIHKNYDRDISIADIAEAAKVSEGHLRRCFKQEMNVRVVNYLMDCRLEHAKTLIREGDFTIDEIWKQTGFTSAQYFSYAFKQNEGVSPREYAKKIHEE